MLHSNWSDNLWISDYSKDNLFLLEQNHNFLKVFFFLSCRGSAVAKIVGNNVKKLQKFASTVKMWVFEENINGRKLTDIINNEHENVKYLPGYKLPDNVVRLRS